MSLRTRPNPAATDNSQMRSAALAKDSKVVVESCHPRMCFVGSFQNI